MGSSEAGTSSGSEYQVFLNFRGSDTRSGFTDFLYHSLTDAGICVFRDSEKLHVGERIDGALQRAIDNSRIYIPIFSRNYASSQWCLRELAQIVENTSKSNENREILPIFFDVEPDDVKMKTQLYHDAILNLKREKRLRTKQVNSWREALKEVDAIKGWEVKKYKGQGKLIKLVVEEVLKRLKIREKPVTKHLIGIDDQVVAVRKLLDIDSGGVRLIQIHGMGGIGKTTLAKVMFNQLSTHFGKCCCFLEDVREKSSRINGLVELQNKLLSEIGNVVGTRSIDEIGYGMKRIEETLHKKKVFVVLDDVDKSEQVEKLIGKGALCSGSRVLITTRNIDVLPIPEQKYEMELMSGDHALQLFNRHAFNNDSPSNDRYDISKEIVNASGRLPLTIEVIGSLLYNKTQELWNETLEKLRKARLEDVSKKLRISYDALTLDQQQIFLDIACFFIGEKKANAIHMWRDCDFFPIGGIDVLKSKSLIKIGENNEFWMHDQLRDLGREIVRQENPMNPEERSRLWIQEEVIHTIRTKKMKKNVQAMKLELYHAKEPIKSEEIGRFENLRFFSIHGGTLVGNLMDCFPNLRWIDWNSSKLKCQLTNMCLKNLVVLQLCLIDGIDDLKLWSLIKEARKLKVLILIDCHRITKTPDLSGCSTLERLIFWSCSGLRKSHCSIGKLKHLIELKFIQCPQFEGLLEEIGDLHNLERFSLTDCCGIKGLPDSIYKWKSLRELRLSIRGPVELSTAIRKLGNLEVLCIEADLKGQLPSEIGLLPRLQLLVLKGCDEIRELPVLPISLFSLEVSSRSLQVVPNLSNLTNLIELDLSDDFDIDEQDKVHIGDLRWIGRLSELEELSLRLLHVSAPTELASLSQLKQLKLSGLNLQPFTQLPSSLLDLTLESFKSIALLSSNLKNLSNLQLIRSQMQEIKLDGLQLPSLTTLCLDDCGPLERLMLSSMTKLKEVLVEDCRKLNEIDIDGVLESLEKLRINGCESFTRFVYVDIQLESSHESSLILASGVFNELQSLWLQHCPKILSIQVLGTLESLEELLLCSCRHLQSLGLSNFNNLKSLTITDCHELRIVEGLNKLEFLSNLFLNYCRSLESLIDVSTTQLPNECDLYIGNCPELRGVKQGFRGSLECFKCYKEEESVPAALTDRLMVGHAEGGTAAAAAAAAAADDLAKLFGKLELQQQHVTVEGGRGDVEVGSVHFQGRGGGDREEEDGGRDQTLGHYSRGKRKRR